MLASGIFELSKIHGGVFSFGIGNLALATVVAGVTGYASIAWLLRYLMKNTTMVFVWHRIALGALRLALLASGAISG